MKNITFYLFIVIGIVGLYGFAYTIANEDEPEGKKLFVEYKCNMCHTVKSVGIESKKSDAHDIVQLDNEKNTEFWLNYLMKKEKLNGKDHKTAFKGGEEDLRKLVDWMMALKKDEE